MGLAGCPFLQEEKRKLRKVEIVQVSPSEVSDRDQDRNLMVLRPEAARQSIQGPPRVPFPL